MNNFFIQGLVSIIIPVFNRPQMIVTAVESVLNQTYQHVEVIIVDDGSTDETPQVLQQISSDHPGVVKVIRQENSGPGRAREQGRLEAQGEFIQYLDSDDWLLPRKFEVQVQALDEHPECAIAYGKSRFVDANGVVICEPSKLTGQKMDYLFPALLVDRWWHTHTPLYRRSISDAAGEWPERRPEDWDLEGRMGALKARLVYCDEVVSCQRSHPGVNRVHRSSRDQYILDEAWFLPRLYNYAIQAGVKKDSPEMDHFSRWVFMRARHLGALGESTIASDLFAIAQKSQKASSWSMKLVGLSAKLLGWKATGKICSLRELFPVSSKA